MDTTTTPTPETDAKHVELGIEYSVMSASYYEMRKHARAMESRALAAEAEVERLRGAVKWQPMDTAPRDGREILAVGRVGTPYVVVCRNGKNEWYMQEADCYRDPVAWMPLPAPPITNKGTPHA